MRRRLFLLALSLGWLAQSALSAVPPAEGSCAGQVHPALMGMREFAGKAKVEWQSEIVIAGKRLSPALLTDPTRAEAIVRGMMTPELVQQLQRELGLGADLQDPRLWDLYFRAYDAVSFSQAYVDLLFRFDRDLPPVGRILDLGGGTGNFPAFFLHQHPGRRAVLIDKSPYLAEDKLRYLHYDEAQFQVIKGDILDEALYRDLQNSDAALLNNVLYTLPPEGKRKVLQLVFDHLRPGGTLLVGDLLPAAQTPDRAARYLLAHLHSGLKNGAPITELSLALLIAVNSITSRSSGPRYFMGPEDLANLATSVGFRLKRKQKITYYRSAAYSVFERP